MYKKFLLSVVSVAFNMVLTQPAYSTNSSSIQDDKVVANAPVFDSNTAVPSENIRTALSPNATTPGLSVPYSENKEEQFKLKRAALENMAHKKKTTE
ncbi:MAG: hypothetical protein SFT68_04725 [Rickettsiaceae bacterium]|nr:hypothetical protein [Rickettsiaceae bacterium]